MKNIGDRGNFMTSCGIEITGEIVGANENGYIVKGDGIESNEHTDGLFRFTFG